MGGHLQQLQLTGGHLQLPLLLLRHLACDAQQATDT